MLTSFGQDDVENVVLLDFLDTKCLKEQKEKSVVLFVLSPVSGLTKEYIFITDFFVLLLLCMTILRVPVHLGVVDA